MGNDLGNLDDIGEFGDLGDLFGGDDLLSLLDDVQEQQNKNEGGTTASEEKPAEQAASSEEAFKKLVGSLGDEAKELMSGNAAEAAKEEVKPAAAAKMDDYDKAVYGYPQLDEIEKGIKRGLDVSFYDSAELSFRQMREIRIGLELGLDVSYYSSKYYKDAQMREIRLGLMEKIDVGSYARLIYSLPDMQRMRNELMGKAYAKDPQALDFLVTDMDTNVQIYTMDGLMNAFIQLKEPLPKGWNRKKLQTLLKIYGIEYGLMLDQLDNDLSTLKVGEEIQVARGEESLQGEDGWYEYFVDNLDDSSPHIEEDGSINYMAQKKYSYAQPGQKVALYHPATLGHIGKTVKGLDLPASSGKNLPRLNMDKIRLLEDGVTYVAKKEGFVSIKNGILNIVEQLEFKEDVGYGNGNIAFDGDIYIRASVLENAVIQAGGDIVVDGFVESAVLKAGKDIILRKGMNGDGRGSLEANGNVVAAFFENANILAGGDVEANYILNSDVRCLGMVKTQGSKNMICGGTVSAKQGIKTGTAGNKYQVKTTLEAGGVSDGSDRASQLYRRRKQLAEEMEKVRTGMAMVLRKVGALNGRTHPMYLKFQDVLEQQKQEMAALNEEQEVLDEDNSKNLRVFVIVENTAYENTRIVINGVANVLNADVTRSRFYSRGRQIVHEPFTGG